MINIGEVIETNEMIEKENLDVRTITLGISLLDCIDSDLEYKEYQQEQFRKEDSIEGPMSCFEHGYYMDESSNSDYDERSFMEEYDFEDNLTFEMESEIYGSDFKSEMDDYGEEEYYQKQIAEHERQIREDELKQIAEHERQFPEGK